MKRLFVLLVMFSILFSSLQVYAENDKNDVKALYVMHVGSKAEISCESELEKLPLAGLSRLPALVVAAKAVECGELDLSRKVSVSANAAKVKGTTAFIEAGEVICVESLFKSAAMICAGDAVYSILENLCGSEDAAVKKINSLFYDLGIDAKVNGIIDDSLMLCAKDIATLATELSKCEVYLKYSSAYMDEIAHEKGNTTELVNSNRLIKNLQGCKGLITGSSTDAGYCGAFYTERNGSGCICVVLGAKNSNNRFFRAQSETKAFFTNYREIKIAKAGDSILYDYPVNGASVKMCTLCAAHDLSIITQGNQSTPICSYDLPAALEAPLKAGDTIGNARYTDENGTLLCVLELTVKKDIKKARFTDFFKTVITCWLLGM